MAARVQDWPRAHHFFLWPVKMIFYAWLALTLMAVASMGAEIFLAKQVWGDAAALTQAQQTLRQDIQLTRDLRQDAPLTGLAEACAKGVYWFFFQLIPFERWMTNAALLPANPDITYHGGDVIARNHLVYHVQDEIYLAMYRAQIFGVRLAILIGTAPLFLLVWSLGLVDGLTQRYIRRACAGRESSSMYHRAKFFQFAGLGTGAMIYLMWPTSVRPEWIVLPLAVMVGLLSRVQWTYLKKYL